MSQHVYIFSICCLCMIYNSISFFKRCFLNSHRNVFQHFSSSKLNYRNLPKTFPRSLSGVNSKCLSDNIVLGFENAVWYVIFKTNLLSFLIGFRFWKRPTSEIFSPWGFILLPNCNCNLFLSATPHYDIQQKVVFRTNSVKTQGLAERYWFFTMGNVTRAGIKVLV